jgi:hypothetical protein
MVANVRDGHTQKMADKVGWPVNWWPTLVSLGWDTGMYQEAQFEALSE